MFLAERLDFDINAGGKLKFHQRVHGLLRGLENVEQALVGTNFKLFARLLVTWGERNTQYLFFTVGNGIGPAICAPVRFAVSTISLVDWSRTR